MKIGKNINIIRRSLGMSKEELASKSGYASSQVITGIENGNSEPSYDKIKDLSNALGVSIYQLKGSKKLYNLKDRNLNQSDWLAITMFSPILNSMTEDEQNKLFDYALLLLKAENKKPLWETFSPSNKKE